MLWCDVTSNMTCTIICYHINVAETTTSVTDVMNHENKYDDDDIVTPIKKRRIDRTPTSDLIHQIATSTSYG